MKRKRISILVVPLLAACAAFGFILFRTDIHKEIQRRNEKEVRAKIEAAFGKVYVTKGEADKILVADIRFDTEKESNVDIRYAVDGHVGRLNIEMCDSESSGDAHRSKGKFRGISIPGFQESTWNLKFTDSVPIAFDIELGAGMGEFDMSGLMVKDFKLATGASKVTVTFNDPNPAVIENMKVETGVSRFVGKHLGNANFRKFKFEGGIGSYTLDFSGELRREASVDIDLGLGSVEIKLPKTVGAKIEYNGNWLSSHSFDNFTERRDGEYYSYNYNDAEGRINIRVSSGLGSVKVRWVSDGR